MSRRKRVITKEVKRDLRYGSPLVARLITTVMRGGKRSLAERIVYTAIESTRDGTEAVEVPVEVRPSRRLALAMRWIVGFASKRKSIPMSKALASELKEAASNQGAAIKKRDDLHKMAQANRAFAHFRW